MRADFYANCALYPRLAALVSAHQELVGPMDPKDLRRAIEKPAQMMNCRFEPGLVDTLIHDIGVHTSSLPLLQHALSELWNRRTDSVLSHQAYANIGRLEGALDRRAEEVFRALATGNQNICRRIFLRLIEVREGVEYTRGPIPLGDLYASTTDHGKTDVTVTALADARQLTMGTEAKSDRPTVEIAHEALIRGWARLHQWIESDRAELRLHERLSDSAREWRTNAFDDSYLFRGSQLAAAVELQQRAELLGTLARSSTSNRQETKPAV
jgi:hypothetical protein